MLGGGCTRGMGLGWGAGGLYRVLPSTLQDPIFRHIPKAKPYLRPNEGNSHVNDEVSQTGSRIDLNIDQN